MIKKFFEFGNNFFMYLKGELENENLRLSEQICMDQDENGNYLAY